MRGIRCGGLLATRALAQARGVRGTVLGHRLIPGILSGPPQHEVVHLVPVSVHQVGLAVVQAHSVRVDHHEELVQPAHAVHGVLVPDGHVCILLPGAWGSSAASAVIRLTAVICQEVLEHVIGFSRNRAHAFCLQARQVPCLQVIPHAPGRDAGPQHQVIVCQHHAPAARPHHLVGVSIGQAVALGHPDTLSVVQCLHLTLLAAQAQLHGPDPCLLNHHAEVLVPRIVFWAEQDVAHLPRQEHLLQVV
mmetsp:Transcript_28428/g.62526  ORF Transcript_28428/g.62526 Transcript_28428/m.62526 type:complete len:248 (-) Transcript_28428:840-1583(-)